MENKNITVKQFQAFAEKADERLDKLEQNKADRATIRNISIPASGWVATTDEATLSAGFSYYIDVEVSGLTSTDSVDTELNLTSLEMAKTCGVAVISEIRDGAIRYFAAEKPTTNLTAQLRVVDV